MNNSTTNDRNSAGVPGGAKAGTRPSPAPAPVTAGRASWRAAGHAPKLPGVGSGTGSLRSGRPRAAAEATQGGLPKTRVVDPPRPRLSPTGTVYIQNVKPIVPHLNRQPSNAAGPSSGLHRGSPLFPLRQNHVHGKMGKGLPSVAHKTPQTNKLHGYMRGHGRKPASSMNVILPPPNAHSATGSVMDSQMFPRNTPLPNRARPSEFSTFNVQVQPNPTAFQEASERIRSINNNPAVKDDSTKAVDAESDEKEKALGPIAADPEEGDIHQKSKDNENPLLIKNIISPEDSTLTREREIPQPQVFEDANAEIEICENEKILSSRGEHSVDHKQEINAEIPSHIPANGVVNNEPLRHPDLLSKYLENLWRTELVGMDSTLKHAQTAPTTAKPSSTTFTSKSGKASCINSNENKPCRASASHTLLTELGFLQELKSRAASKHLGTSYPQKPQTAMPLLPVPTITETDLLKAAFQESCKNISERPVSEQGISEETKPSLTDIIEVDDEVENENDATHDNDFKDELTHPNEYTQ